MRFKNLFLYLLAIPAIITSKISVAQNLKPAIKIDTDVYVVGTVQMGSNRVAAYWKNGIMTQLSDSTIDKTDCYGKGIAVIGSNVYVTGYYKNRFPDTDYYKIINADTRAIYWKNGVETDFTLQSEAYAIAIKDTDVYIAGAVYDDSVGVGYHAVYWKNGTIINLSSEMPSYAYAIAVNKTGVYIAGHIADSAAYWKNGIITTTNLGKDLLYSSANAIAYNGTDIYAAGSTNLYSPASDAATYWKNGKAIYLTNGVSGTYSYAQAIAVNGNDIHVAGYSINSNGYPVATYWKNGVAISLTEDKIPGEVQAITLVGNDVYLVGSIYINDADQAVYWKNGVMKTLAGGDNATGIVVITHPNN